METTRKQLKQLESIESKVHKLLSRYEQAQKALAVAQQEIKRLELEVSRREAEIKNFQNQENISKIVDTIAADPANSTELKLKINEYIREIDKCIAYLRD